MIGAIVQVRMESTRFPGKALKPISGKPMVWHILKRIEAVKTIEKIIIVTPDTEANKPLIDFLRLNKCEVFVGDKDGYVLDYFYHAAKQNGFDIIARVTADDPFKDPEIIDYAVSLFKEKSVDYVANCSYDGSIAPTYPEGLDIEVFSFKCLSEFGVKCKCAKIFIDVIHMNSFLLFV